MDVTRKLQYIIFQVTLFILFGISFSCYAQIHGNIPSGIRDSVSTLIKEAGILSNQGSFKTAEEKILTAQSLHHSAQYVNAGKVDTVYTQIRSSLAWYKTLDGKYLEAEHLFTEIIRQLPDTAYMLLSENYMRLSSLYGMQKAYDTCEKYSQLALKYAGLANDSLLIFHSRSNLGDVYLYTEQYEKALAEYYEVRRLSVLLNEHEAISLGNLAIVHHKMGKNKIAEQYYIESLKLSQNESRVVYSIVLSEYCRFLIDNGRKIQARNLLLDAIRDGQESLFGEYNKAFLLLLFETSDAFKPFFWGAACIVILLISILLYIVFHYRKKMLREKAKCLHAHSEVNILRDEIAFKTNNGNSDMQQTEKEESENTTELLSFISLTESYPQMQKYVQKIKLYAGNRTDVMTNIKQLEQLLLPLEDNTDKKLSAYLEENSKLARNLKKRFPDLSIAEMRLCILIRKGLNTKEIATLTHRSTRGVESAKFRMRKKMNLDAQKNIYDCLQETEEIDLS